jgi:LPS sulfotransferase NodH
VFDAPTIAKYEHYLQQHYPEVVARMLGEYVTPRQQRVARVTPAMVDQLKAAMAHPLGPSVRPAKKNPRAIFVLSPPRSGSTLLRAMLAGHPQLFAPPELYLLSYDNLADRKQWFSGSHRSQLEGNIRALMQIRNESAESAQALMRELEARACATPEYYAMLQEWLGERILVDKTPAYAVDPEALRRAEDYFEDPFYIHLLRHPYAMVRSFEEAKLDQLWYPRLTGTDAGSLEAFPFARRQLAEMIWLILHQNILNFLKDVPARRQCQLRFEEVVSNPEPAMTALCASLGLEFAPAMLSPQDDKKQRMTDGLHSVSRMIGDPKFHQFKRIESSVADQWKQAYETDFLSAATLQLAATLGYRETVADVRGRDEIEL